MRDEKTLDDYDLVLVEDSKIVVFVKILINLFLAVFGVLFWVMGFFCKMAAGAFLVGCDAFDEFFRWVND